MWPLGYPLCPGLACLPVCGPDPCSPLQAHAGPPFPLWLPASSVLSPGHPTGPCLAGKLSGLSPSLLHILTIAVHRALREEGTGYLQLPEFISSVCTSVNWAELHADLGQFLHPANIHLPRCQALHGRMDLWLSPPHQRSEGPGVRGPGHRVQSGQWPGVQRTE